jgi:hypothetical protein
MARKEKVVSQDQWIIDQMVEEDGEDYWRLRNNVIGMYMAFDDVAFAADFIMFKYQGNNSATFKQTAFKYRIKELLKRVADGDSVEEIVKEYGDGDDVENQLNEAMSPPDLSPDE